METSPLVQETSAGCGFSEEMSLDSADTSANEASEASPETTDVKKQLPRRKSLPFSTMGLQMKFKNLRRMSERLKFVSEGSREDTPDDPGVAVPEAVASTKLEVKDGVVCVADLSEIGMLAATVIDEHLIHLVYGEGYTGVEGSSEAIPDDLLLVLEKTPDLQTLELRGFWNFTNLPGNFVEYLANFPQLKQLSKLVLPREGLFLDRMGSILVGKFGLQLSSLECPVEFMDGMCPKDISELLPNLKSLKTFETTMKLLESLLLAKWTLETLHLGPLRATDSVIPNGVPIIVMESVATLFGSDLKEFSFSFCVNDDNGESMDEASVDSLLQLSMPQVEFKLKSPE